MSKQVKTAAEAAAERAAIRAELAAKNIPAEVKEPKFERTPEMIAADKARAAIGKVQLSEADRTPVARPLNSRAMLERDMSRADRAALAAYMIRTERTVRRAEAKRAAKRAAKEDATGIIGRGNFPALTEAAGVSAEALEDYRRAAEAAEVLGVSLAAAAEMIGAEADYAEPEITARPVGVDLGAPIRPVNRPGVPFEYMQDSEAAEAARTALAATGPRSGAVIIANVFTETLTVARPVPVPRADKAAEAAAEAAEALAAAEAKLAAAEAKLAAAIANKAKRPILAAEDDCNRIAAAIPKLAERAALAGRLAEAAEALARLDLDKDVRPELAIPVMELPLHKAAEAGRAGIKRRADHMPPEYRENGPRVKAAALASGRGSAAIGSNGVSDPVGNSAAALADGYRAKIAAAERAARELAEKTNLESIRAAAELEVAERMAAYKERRAEAARVRRAEAAAARKASQHGKARAAKRRAG